MTTRIDLSALRNKLQGNKNGKNFWRSLEEAADTPEFQEMVRQEFPRQTYALDTDRRTFLKLMGAAVAMASLAGCTQLPREPIVPYVEAPEDIVPGQPLFFATAMPLGGYGQGLLVENHMGRPTKIEGNPDHPASLGGTSPYAQGAIFSLYDVDRAEVMTRRGQISTWERFLQVIRERMALVAEAEGAGFHILTETVTSPTLGAQINELLAAMPGARWHQYNAIGLDNVRAGAQLAFGDFVNTVYRFGRARRILSLDANFLSSMPGSLRYARTYADWRRVWAREDMNRLYMVESSFTITGAKADHRLPMRAGQIGSFARAIAAALGIDTGAPAMDLAEAQALWLEAVVEDLQAFPGESIVIAGEEQPPAVHALAHAMNEALGNVGNTVVYTEPVEVNPVLQSQSLLELTEAMAAGEVHTLLIFDCNPVFTAPADLDFGGLLDNVEFAIHHSLHFDETSARCEWHIPANHFLESWSDVRAFDGTTTIMQPLLERLFQSRTSHEVLAAMMGLHHLSSHDVLRRYWQGYFEEMADPPAENFEQFWRRSLHDGFVQGTAAAPVEVTAALNWGEIFAGEPVEPEGLELIFRPDPSIWDGRFANNPWLQELPKPLSTLTWDNAAYISPVTAERLGLASNDMVDLRFRGRALLSAIWVMPGHPDDAVTLTLGYGHTWENEISQGLGFNAYALRTSDALWFGAGLEIRPMERTYPLATTQMHYTMEGRDLVRVATHEEFQENPTFAQIPYYDVETPPSLYPDWQYEGYSWGMVIDHNACIGCNACVIACQVENNIPTVGKAGVMNGREMHWLKIDTYFEGDLDTPDVYFQPRPCMHCEKAPCEPVCPVAATVHDSEGLNQMIYNRCVGTRYCSNNCPYKVRRFNFLEYVDPDNLLLAMWRNPDVTVRTRGVIEKCSYCVQRINHARIRAEQENRLIQDGEIYTACQQACPTEAIVFGNINDEDALVTQMKASPLNYGLLAELGTRPRTTYLGEVRNPNPRLEGMTG
jgi:MoCo/4Fe-4S cofactor protein with predicted Tat translocation signal